jgi:hypothetical protein
MALVEQSEADRNAIDRLVEHRIAQLEAETLKNRAVAETVIRLGDAMLEVKRDLERGHTRMDEQDECLDSQSERISVLEQALPVLREYGEWVKRSAFGIYGILAAVIAGVLIAALSSKL